MTVIDPEVAEQIARRLHELAIEVAEYEGDSYAFPPWEGLDVYARWHYIGSAGVIIGHFAQHAGDHFEWLCKRVHDVRYDKQLEQEWESLSSEEQEVARDIMHIIQGESSG